MYKFLALGAHSELRSITKVLEKKHDTSLMVAQYRDLEIIIRDGQSEILCKGEDICSFDFVWLKSSWLTRSVAHTVSIHLDKYKVPYTPIEKERSKLVDNIVLMHEGVSIPETYFTPVSSMRKNLSKIEEVCGYPFIIKIARGSLGKGIFLINNEADFKETLPKLKKKRSYICQRFIPNDFDYRIIVARDKILSGEKRIRQGDEFRNNAYLGAKEEFLALDAIPAKIKDLAIRAAQKVGLEWTGIDILTSSETGKSYVLELNRRPGLTADSSEISAAFEHIVNLLVEQRLLEDS